MRGKPMGSHCRIGSLPSGVALGPNPGLLESNFDWPHAVIAGNFPPGPWPPDPGCISQTPDRSRRGTLTVLFFAGFDFPSLDCAPARNDIANIAVSTRIEPLRLRRI